LQATEPFPDGLFRVPVPDTVFAEMPDLSDAALRSLLALLHLSFRFDPAESTWVHAGDWLLRRDVEAASGLSDQGTRNGLNELDAAGWIEVDRSGRSHQYQLLTEVPERRFTYLPSSLLEAAPRINSGTELRVVLAVLRQTWGWTSRVPGGRGGDGRGGPRVVHDRWAALSAGRLRRMTGRSTAAIKTAAQALQGRWIERVRPGHGAYQYRFLPEAIGDGSGDPSSFSAATANKLPPDRQRNTPPSSNKESSSSRQQARAPDPNSSPSPARPQGSPERGDAVPMDQIPPDQRPLARKLLNVGVWPRRIPALLRRFSAGRIEANFHLYRQRATEETIHRPGAWLNRAITQGFAPYTTGADTDTPSDQLVANDKPLPPLTDKTRVSEAVKSAYVDRGTPESAFHLCKPGSAKPYMYFDPEGDGPTRRV
jgi:hypothetical protein